MFMYGLNYPLLEITPSRPNGPFTYEMQQMFFFVFFECFLLILADGASYREQAGAHICTLYSNNVNISFYLTALQPVQLLHVGRRLSLVAKFEIEIAC